VEKWTSWLEIEARAFGVNLGRAQLEQLEQYSSELLRWNARLNLTSIVEPAAVAELHLLDSLAIAPHVPEGSRVLDVGSGAGLPGVPLAIARSDLRVRMVDRTEKKVLFLRAVLARLGLQAEAAHERVEAHHPASGAPFDVVVSRALTDPLAWLPMARTQVRPGGRILAMLGSEAPSSEATVQALGADRLELDLPYALPSGARRRLWVVERA
jgi:16S rRNA (guanine527-N7)-methyltransferase